MRHEQGIRPFRQGHLDSFCGAYCIVNAVHLVCGPITQPHAMALLQEIMAFLNRRVSLVERVSSGTTLQDVGGVMRQVLDTRHVIRRCKPFRGRASVGLDDYWDTVRQFIEQREGAVVTAFGGRIDHWTVIRDVTNHRLLLFDSIGMQQVARRYCIMASDPPSLSRYILCPTYTYFLWVDPT